jgi:hypothetical protein
MPLIPSPVHATVSVFLMSWGMETIVLYYISILRNLLVGVTPQPSFARLGRGNDRMMDLMVMRGHMPVRGIVAAEGYPTGLAGTQVQPPAVYFDAFFADILLSRFDLLDRA